MEKFRSLAALLALALALRSAMGAPGDPDSLNPSPVGDVYVAMTQPDGKIIIAGSISKVGVVNRQNIARLNSDGSLDETFAPNANGQIRTVAIQADGKILVGGMFTSIDGVLRSRVARLNGDGSVDTTFNANADNTVNCIAIETGGSILLGGFFTTINGSTRNAIARVSDDGTLDADFSPNANGTVRTILPLPGGSIMVAGEFTSLSGATRNRLARLASNGSAESYHPNVSNTVWSVVALPSGQCIIGGDFTMVGGTTIGRIARVNADGSLDTAYSPNCTVGAVRTMALRTDGKVVVGFGNVATIAGQTRNRIAQINADGSLDTGFAPDMDSNVQSVSVDGSGKVLVGGPFSTVSGTARPRLARLENDAATDSLAVASLSRIEWLRGGAMPESAAVSFSMSADSGVTWSALGAGSRIAGGWEITGLSLPGSGLVRARAVTTGGLSCGSSGLVEKTVGISPEIAVEQPAGSELPSGVGRSFAAVAVGGNSTLSFTVKNLGIGTLTGVAASISGPDQVSFELMEHPTSSVSGPAGSTSFTVKFTAGSSGVMTATLQISSNDSDENPYVIPLSARGLSPADDSDGDGLNDAAELLLSGLGFDWQIAQPGMVSTFMPQVNAAGLYTSAQIQALHVGTPLLERSPSTGEFTLTLGVEISSDLSTFEPFPMTVPQTSINGQGQLEFRFEMPDAAFLKVGVK